MGDSAIASCYRVGNAVVLGRPHMRDGTGYEERDCRMSLALNPDDTDISG